MPIARETACCRGGTRRMDPEEGERDNRVIELGRRTAADDFIEGWWDD